MSVVQTIMRYGHSLRVKIDNDYHHPLRDWKEMFCVGNETDFLLYLHLATGQIAHQTHHEDFGSDVDYSGSAIL